MENRRCRRLGSCCITSNCSMNSKQFQIKGLWPNGGTNPQLPWRDWLKRKKPSFNTGPYTGRGINPAPPECKTKRYAKLLGWMSFSCPNSTLYLSQYRGHMRRTCGQKTLCGKQRLHWSRSRQEICYLNIMPGTLPFTPTGWLTHTSTLTLLLARCRAPRLVPAATHPHTLTECHSTGYNWHQLRLGHKP
jgi:hypothetical protein